MALTVQYGGVLNDRHLRAAIRAALRAHGFTVARPDFARAMAERWRLGCWLRDRLFPDSLPDFVNIADYQAIAGLDPYLWERLPVMAALGFQEAAVLHGLVDSSAGGDNSVSILGAAFNTAIALLDYLIDEHAQAAVLFKVLNPDLIQGIFESPNESELALARAYNQLPDLRLRLLLALVAFCAAKGRELYRRSGNNLAWADLAQTIAYIYEAERTISLADFPTLAETRRLLPAIEAKSTLPAVVMLQISTLTTGRPQAPAWIQQASKTLGRIFWLIDDLVDLLVDGRQGRPSLALLRLGDRITAQGRTRASETDIYDLVAETAAELLELLAAPGFGWTNAGPDDAPLETEAGDRSRPAIAALLDFTHLTVSGWTRWEEEADIRVAPFANNGHNRVQVAQGAVVTAATGFLLSQQRDGYREALHHLRFPRVYPDGIHYETQPAQLSFRAVALDGLLDAYQAGLLVPRQVLDAEALALLRLKHRYTRGGWSYLSQVPELPPDTDDLGQVLQALYRIGGPALAAACDEAIRLALDLAGPDGGFPTWILDPRGRSALDDQMRAYLAVMGGGGVHPEVVANLLYGLILYDPVRYRQPLLDAVTYLETVQAEQGHWSSKWYAGPYYGTYRVALVLSHLSPDSAALSRARAFLLAHQHGDGGWGDHESEPLSTAFALLALATPGLGAEAGVIRPGLAYLAATQQADGAWPAQTWISFPWTEAHWPGATGSASGVVAYGSRTMTTTFCLKAFLATGS